MQRSNTAEPDGALDTKFQAFLSAAPDAIVVVDVRGRIVAANTLAEEMFGYAPQQLLGERVEVLVPDADRSQHHLQREQYSHAPRTRPMGPGRELTGRRKDGGELPVERRMFEEQIQTSLREKEALLREIHHRVKNNLQITSSLLRLQASNIDNVQARAIFEETQLRIRSMALVQEKLYQAKNLTRINFGEYVQPRRAALPIVQQIDGSLEVRSIIGTEFRIEFPTERTTHG